jgi:hypothetical protein
LINHNALGAKDLPFGEGYSPYFHFDGVEHGAAVRFLDLPETAQWGEYVIVVFKPYNDYADRILMGQVGAGFIIKMGNTVVGDGSLLEEAD